MKKTLLYVLVFCLPVLGISAQEVATIGGIKYSLNLGEAIVMQQDKSLNGEIVIPESVTYNGEQFRVTTVGANAFDGCKVTKVQLPASITKIRKSSFTWCTSLTHVNIPAGVEVLEEGAFSNCTSLSSISLPNSVTELGPGCFEKCSSLSTIEFSSGLKTLGRYCFSDCGSLTSVTLPTGVETLGERCFQNCDRLKKVVLPNTITKIDDTAFGTCDSLVSVNIPNQLTALGDYVFERCTELPAIVIPEGITSIGFACFDGCKKLASVTLPSTLSTTGERCFANCTSLEFIELPRNLKEVGYTAFQNCTALTSITLPESVTRLNNYCFGGCSSLMRVVCLWEENIPGNYYAFSQIYPDAKLYVPRGTTDKYKAVEPYERSFSEIVEYDKEDVLPTILTPCATPSIAYVNGELVFGCTTENSKCHYTIAARDAVSNAEVTAEAISLCGQYDIEAYATAPGFAKSEYVTATLCFIGGAEDETAIVVPTQRGVVVTSNGGMVTVRGLEHGERVSVYMTNGMLVGSTTAQGDMATLDTGASAGSIVLVKIGSHTLKVTLK